MRIKSAQRGRRPVAFVEYILVALLGSVGAAAPGGSNSGSSVRTFDADAIAQPSGGAAGEGYLSAGIVLPGQATGGSPGKQGGTGRKGRRRTARRHHRTSGGRSGATSNVKREGKDKK
jgi:hypothetical protein